MNKTEYRLYIPLGGKTLRCPRNLEGTYPTRADALVAAEKYCGPVLIDQVRFKTTEEVTEL